MVSPMVKAGITMATVVRQPHIQNDNMAEITPALCE